MRSVRDLQMCISVDRVDKNSFWYHRIPLLYHYKDLLEDENHKVYVVHAIGESPIDPYIVDDILFLIKNYLEENAQEFGVKKVMVAEPLERAMEFADTPIVLVVIVKKSNK